MSKFFRILAIVYLSTITIIVFLPFSLLEKVFIILRDINKKKSTFVEPNKRVCISFLSIKYFSIKSFFLNIFLFPILPLIKNQSREIFKTLNKKRNETPKEVALVVNRQLSENIKQIYSKTKNNNINYLFMLQPTLFYSGPTTEDDKQILHFREKNKYKGFYFKEFFEEFYDLVKATLEKDQELKNHFCDISNLFSRSKDQDFIDAVHLGDLAQDKCEKKIVEIIKLKEK